jgi:hypothetical protein
MRRFGLTVLYCLAVLGALSLWNDGPRSIVIATQIDVDLLSYRITGNFLPFKYWMPDWLP